MTYTPALILSRAGYALLLDDSGQGLVEYALIIALMAVVIVGALSALGGKNNTGISNSAQKMPG